MYWRAPRRKQNKRSLKKKKKERQKRMPGNKLQKIIFLNENITQETDENSEEFLLGKA